ncbi:hypothetical protein K2173_022255 [Erythroxylum novogranatense]|uniref:AB hydrolase-1 domain-containing protein n=1 Tax=Erythroxylum novogranatense TaxID=1862640 RepID=A0AAV8SUE4_9ROSI|nr:hypothetical protein K2173_022255 [Erythroxylum novogranatense]
MSRWFSFTASRDWFFRNSFANAGLRAVSTDFGDGTVMNCWVPRTYKPSKPNLLLVHGFGANAMWQYGEHLRHFTPGFNVYVPDLLFFGHSYTTRRERSESFQAQCVMRLMETHGIVRMNLVGISYGGFVGYSMASQFPEAIEKLVLCCAGVCLEEKDMEDGLFKVANLDEAANILLPQTPEKLRELMRLSFVKPTRGLPSCFLWDFIDVMCTEFVEEKRELIRAILQNRKFSDLPKITQQSLIIWGEEDQVFPAELSYRLKSHLGDNAELVIIKNAGHAVNLEKSKQFIKHLKSFLVSSNPHLHL